MLQVSNPDGFLRLLKKLRRLRIRKKWRKNKWWKRKTLCRVGLIRKVKQRLRQLDNFRIIVMNSIQNRK